MKLPLLVRTSRAAVSPMMPGASASVGAAVGQAGLGDGVGPAQAASRETVASRTSPRAERAPRHRADAASLASNSRSANETGMVPP